MTFCRCLSFVGKSDSKVQLINLHGKCLTRVKSFTSFCYYQVISVFNIWINIPRASVPMSSIIVIFEFQFGTPVHEIGHTLGLWHEHQRWDRDKYIRIITNNVANYRSQFWRQRTDTFELPYDYGSIMHYGSKVRVQLIQNQSIPFQR